MSSSVKDKNSAYYEQIESGTAFVQLFVEENFQLTHDESVLGVQYGSGVPEYQMHEISPDETLKLVVIDGELRPVRDDAPPDLRPLSQRARILQVRG